MNVASSSVSKYSLVLLAITFIGLFLRVYHLGAESIWVDEISSLWISNTSAIEIINRAALSDYHPPLYYLLLHVWITLFGTSEFALRSLSALFGVLAIPATYLVGRQLFNKETGLIAALILALSSFNIQYSQEARMYSLLVLMALLSMYFFLRVIRRSTAAMSAGYVLCTTLLVYTHFYGLLVVLAQILYVAALLLLSAREGLQLKRWVSLELIVAVLFAPWVYVLVTRVVLVKVQTWSFIPLPTLGDVMSTLVVNAGTVVLSLLFIIFSVIALFEVRRATGSSDWKSPLNAMTTLSWNVRVVNVASVLLLIIWLFAIQVVPFALSYVKQPIYYARYTIAASVALYVLVAAGIRNVRWNYVKVGVIAVIVILCAANLQAYYGSNGKGEARAAISMINSNAKSGDVLLTFPEWPQSMFYYYNNRTDVALRPISQWSGWDTKDQAHEVINSSVKDHERVWVLASTGSEPTKNQENFILNTLNESYVAVIAKEYEAHPFGAPMGTVNNYDVYLYEKRA